MVPGEKVLGDGINLYFGPTDGSTCVMKDNDIQISDHEEAGLVGKGAFRAKAHPYPIATRQRLRLLFEESYWC